jgi:hypothetical protein
LECIPEVSGSVEGIRSDLAHNLVEDTLEKEVAIRRTDCAVDVAADIVPEEVDDQDKSGNILDVALQEKSGHGAHLHVLGRNDGLEGLF